MNNPENLAPTVEVFDRYGAYSIRTLDPAELDAVAGGAWLRDVLCGTNVYCPNPKPTPLPAPAPTPKLGEDGDEEA
jgi:hypothetical protein